MRNLDFEKNDVSAKNQVSEKFKIFDSGKEGIRILFLGNSITLHERKPEIGWNNNWGMAASKEENDYVHIVVNGMKEKYKNVNYCVTNVGAWELEYWNEEVLESFYKSRDFGADIVIFRLGENVRIGNLSSYSFSENYMKFAQYFSKGAKRLIFTNLFWEVPEIDGVIKSVCEDMKGSFVSLTDLGYDDSNKAIGLFSHNGVAIHPGDLGMKKIAERILSVIKDF